MDILSLVQSERTKQAYSLSAAVLAQRSRFPILSRIGEAVGRESVQPVNVFLQHIAVGTVEEHNESFKELFRTNGETGLRELPAIGRSLAALIAR